MSQLPALIVALLDPVRYPDENPDEVKVIQTQMSFVLLTAKFAYKIRKPVNLGYVDYTTLEKRRFFSNKEVVLNQRLCPDTYIGVIPVVNRHGETFLGGAGEVVDYAVKMKLLSAAGMADSLLVSGSLTKDMISAVAVKIADFHKKAETSIEINHFGDVAAITSNVTENFEQSRPYIDRALSQSHFDSLRKYFDSFLKAHEVDFTCRVNEGRIRDCHGDLHSAHINFSDNGICIYDCIEFNDRFRYGDTASEVAFLAMDIDHYGHAALRQVFVDEYVKKSGDTGLYPLLHFYQAYRAHIRAKVACFKLDDPFVPDTEKAQELDRAKGYFDLALAYSLPRPQLFITVGFTGCGKSTLAKALSCHLGLVHLSSDVARKTMAGIVPTERVKEQFAKGLYSNNMTEMTYSALLLGAEENIKQGNSVIIDATFLRQADREQAVELARRLNADFMVIDCQLSDEEIRERLEQRLTETTTSDGCWEVYRQQKSRYQPVTELPAGRNHVIIDTRQAVADSLQKIIGYLSNTVI
ncbi:hypothetical protein DGWBC_0517 [Dehalogenimonas sp. WBC-2]|nr:hypothetical protein DGWBC_0517 [Dehalogenimonas sp. WBC-2]